MELLEVVGPSLDEAERQAGADVLIGEPGEQDSVTLEIRANWKNC